MLKKVYMLAYTGLALGVIFLGAVSAHAQSSQQSGQQGGYIPPSSFELEQLQAQVDVMLEELNLLQNYRICAEKGLVYQAGSRSVDADGCALPKAAQTTPTSKGATQKGLPTTEVRKTQINNRANNATKNIASNANINKKPLAHSAKTFRLPPPDVVRGENISLKETALPKEGVAKSTSQKQRIENTPLPPVVAEKIPVPKKEEAFPVLEANYPNEKVKQLIEAAVARALEGHAFKESKESALNPLPEVPIQKEQLEEETAVNALTQELEAEVEAIEADAHIPAINTTQERPAAIAQQKAVAPKVKNKTKKIVKEARIKEEGQTPIVPSCRPGEFLTTYNGQVVCQAAANVGKRACPPSTLRVWVEWHSKHIHYSVGYTPHGEEASAQEKSHQITVACDNGKYRLSSVTRNECGGHFCHPNQEPAYSLKYLCNQDATGRCYAQRNGHLLNHVYTKTRISQQY